MMTRLVADGWPRERLFAVDFADPSWGCNADNAETLRVRVAEILAATGAERVLVVAHSMGTLSSRFYLKNLGGRDVVRTYLTLGGMHHGLSSPCLNPLPVCVWQELCENGSYVQALNEAPATPGPTRWVSIYSRSDEEVPPESAHLDGAENIEFDGVAHSGPTGLLEDSGVYAQVRRVLETP